MPASWKVVKVEDTINFTLQQGNVPAKRITYQLANGDVFSLTISDSEFTPDNVNAKISQSVEKLNAVYGMEGPPADNVTYGNTDQMTGGGVIGP